MVSMDGDCVFIPKSFEHLMLVKQANLSDVESVTFVGWVRWKIRPRKNYKGQGQRLELGTGCPKIIPLRWPDNNGASLNK